MSWEQTKKSSRNSMYYIKRVIDRLKAYFRGDARISPEAIRGRIYKKTTKPSKDVCKTTCIVTCDLKIEKK